MTISISQKRLKNMQGYHPVSTGKTDEKALEIIKKKEKSARHKREPIPVYHRIKN